MKALTLKQPTPWALTFGGADVINQPRPAPRGETCLACGGIGRSQESQDAALKWEDPKLGKDCATCNGYGRQPLRVMIHAAAKPDISGLEKAPAAWGSKIYRVGDYWVSIGRHWVTHQRYEDGPFFGSTALGAVVAVATITDWHGWPNVEKCTHGVMLSCGCGLPGVLYSEGTRSWCKFHEAMAEHMRHTSRCSCWADPGVHHWVVGEVTPLPQPVPCAGRTGLWSPPENVTARVLEQLT